MLFQRPNRIVERRSTVSQFASTRTTPKSIPFSLIGRRRKSLSSKSDYRQNANKANKENNSAVINLPLVAENENQEESSAEQNVEQLDEENNNDFVGVPPTIEDRSPSQSNEIALLDLPPIEQNAMRSKSAKSVLEIIGFVDSTEDNPNQSNEENSLLLIDFSSTVDILTVEKIKNPLHQKSENSSIDLPIGEHFVHQHFPKKNQFQLFCH